MEVNSGGHVFFCFFSGAAPEAPESVLIVKFHQTRLMTQSEQFANELTRHLGICAPTCRILRKVLLLSIVRWTQHWYDVRLQTQTCKSDENPAVFLGRDYCQSKDTNSLMETGEDCLTID